MATLRYLNLAIRLSLLVYFKRIKLVRRPVRGFLQDLVAPLPKNQLIKREKKAFARRRRRRRLAEFVLVIGTSFFVVALSIGSKTALHKGFFCVGFLFVMLSNWPMY